MACGSCFALVVTTGSSFCVSVSRIGDLTPQSLSARLICRRLPCTLATWLVDARLDPAHHRAVEPPPQIWPKRPGRVARCRLPDSRWNPCQRWPFVMKRPLLARISRIYTARSNRAAPGVPRRPGPGVRCIDHAPKRDGVGVGSRGASKQAKLPVDIRHLTEPRGGCETEMHELRQPNQARDIKLHLQPQRALPSGPHLPPTTHASGFGPRRASRPMSSPSRPKAGGQPSKLRPPQRASSRERCASPTPRTTCP